jgi:hypothetical protein
VPVGWLVVFAVPGLVTDIPSLPSGPV